MPSVFRWQLRAIALRDLVDADRSHERRFGRLDESLGPGHRQERVPLIKEANEYMNRITSKL